MTLINIETVITRTSGQGAHTKRVVHLKCDVCALEYTVNYCKGQLRQFHYCSRACSHIERRKGGKIEAVAVKNSQQKYGTDNPAQSDAVKAKIRATNIENFGVPCAFQAESVKEKCKEAHRERWGTDSHMQSPVFMEQFEAGMIEKHGVTNVFQLESVQEKSRQTNIEKRGFPYPTQSPEVIATRAANCIEKYGVDNPMKLDSVKAKQVATMLRNHGVVNAYLTPKSRANMRKPEAQQRRLQKLIDLGKHMRSDEEDEVLDSIRSTGTKLLKNVFLNHWLLDAVTDDGQIFIQSDGCYWHALDRDIHAIANSGVKQDRSILKKYMRDRRQEAFFASPVTNPLGVQLVRIVTGRLIHDMSYFDVNIDNVVRLWWPRDRDKLLSLFR